MTRAPVYRHLDAPQTFLGFSFPDEVAVLATVYWVGALTVGVLLAVPAVALTAIALKVYLRNKPPKHAFHVALYWVRQLLAGGTLGSQARAVSPPFPYAARRRPRPNRGAPPSWRARSLDCRGIP